MINNNPVMNQNEPTVLQQLRDCGMRVTAARCAVLEWLIGHPHATADDAHHGVSGRISTISKQAIYDVLSACVEAGLVRQIKPAGHPSRFERRTADNHHHLVCRQCGGIADTDCHTGDTPCLTPLHDHGFAVDEAEIVFWGLCSRCRSDTGSGSVRQIED
jgi:Fe2+ or Zn2+ uptake regulation protein